MARSTEPETPTRSRRVREDLSQWAQSLRFSSLTVLLIVILVGGAIVLTQSVSVYVQQEREIAQLRESVELHRKTVNDIEAEQLKWQDPVYIRAQARERLFYVMPGEVQLTVIDDGVTILPDSAEQVSAELTEEKQNWALALAASVLQSGTTVQTPNEIQQPTG